MISFISYFRENIVLHALAFDNAKLRANNLNLTLKKEKRNVRQLLRAFRASLPNDLYCSFMNLYNGSYRVEMLYIHSSFVMTSGFFSHLHTIFFYRFVFDFDLYKLNFVFLSFLNKIFHREKEILATNRVKGYSTAGLF